ncbi:AMP-binding protein [Streptomyces tanashiensis]|uniref:AMP-binding protein n=1 Tax=Streptomyces tanashiensis TaxID=67367 RepID=UPI0033DC47F5
MEREVAQFVRYVVSDVMHFDVPDEIPGDFPLGPTGLGLESVEILELVDQLNRRFNLPRAAAVDDVRGMDMNALSAHVASVAADHWLAFGLLEGGKDGSSDDDVIWITDGAEVTRAELHHRTDTLAAEFAAEGIGDSCRVAVQMEPGITGLASVLALWRRGATVALLDHRLTPAETEGLLAAAGAGMHLRSRPSDAMVGSFAIEQDWQLERLAGAEPVPCGELAPGGVRLIQFSSGSTGQAKCIGRTAGSLRDELARYAAVDGIPQPGEKLLVLCSPFHTWGLIGGVLYGLEHSVPVVFPAGPLPADAIRAARSAEAVAIYGVPLHFQLLADAGESGDLPSLRLAVSAGEMLQPSLRDEFQRVFGCPLGAIYGLTEVGLVAHDLHGRHALPAVGTPASELEIRVRDEILEISLPVSPYLTDDGVPRYVDGWLRTFDRAEIDPETGVLALKGRADSLFVVGGLKVDLLEVEKVLLDHPQVDDAVVLGADVLEAYIGSDRGVKVADLVSWCQKRLSGSKLPKRFTIVPRLPRTSNGKLVRDRGRLAVEGSQN